MVRRVDPARSARLHAFRRYVAADDLYDTFAGMPQPDDIDARWDGVPALSTWQHYQQTGRNWCFGGTENHVRDVVFSSGYPQDKFVFVSGKVAYTLPGTRPGKISLLRLNADFYSSTYYALVHLFPLLPVAGILIVDDYGAFQGASIATDQYIIENKLALFLSRVNVRLAVKSPSDPAHQPILYARVSTASCIRVSTGCQWSYLSKDLPHKSTMWRYFRPGVTRRRWRTFITR